jgi:hypothetical protein
MRCTHGHHSRQRGESGDTVWDGATQGVVVHAHGPAPRGAYAHTKVQSGTLHPTHTTHASASCEVRSTRRTPVPAAVDNDGHWVAHVATTHCSEVRAEMPSGMVPLRELEYRYRPLHPGGHMHTPGYRWPPSTLYTPLMRQRDPK